MKKNRPSNFTIRLSSEDFSVKPIKCSRFKMKIDIPSKNLEHLTDSNFTLEAAPMANGCLELRVWIGSKYFRTQYKLIDGLIDWSVVDGRTVSKEDKFIDSLKREEARRLLNKKSVKREISHVQHARKAGVGGGVEREGEVLSQEASDSQERRASLSGIGEGQEQQADKSIGQETDEE